MMVRRVDPHDALARAQAFYLLDMIQSEYQGKFGETDPNPEGDLGIVCAPDGGVLLGHIGTEPMAVGGWTRLDATTAVLRRMYVHYRHRRKGYSKALLVAIEHDARLAGCSRMVLETDVEMPIAIHLYSSWGYSATEPFGYYKDSDHSVFLGRDL